MEPKQSGVGGVERVPAQAGEFRPVAPGEQMTPLSPERAVESRPELGAVQAEVAQVAMPALPAPVIAAVDDTAVVATSSAQLVANDDDLIEKEWVDKAKKILAETKDDPYRREYEISKLQVEYVRKRYGRVIGDNGAA